MFVVTGATGLLGNVLVRTLLAQGRRSGARASRAPPRTWPPSPVWIRRSSTATSATPLLSPRPSRARTPCSTWPASCPSPAAGCRACARPTWRAPGTSWPPAGEAGVRRLVYCSSIHAFAVPPPGACCLPRRARWTRPAPAAATTAAKPRPPYSSARRSRRGWTRSWCTPPASSAPMTSARHTRENCVIQCARGRLARLCGRGLQLRGCARRGRRHGRRGRQGRARRRATSWPGDNVTVIDLLQTVEKPSPAPRRPACACPSGC